MTEHKIRIHGDCNFYEISRRVNVSDIGHDDTVIFNFGRCFIFPSAINAILLLSEQIHLKGAEVIFEGADDILDYISRLDVFTALGIDRPEGFRRRDRSHRFLCATRIDKDLGNNAAHEITDFIARNVPTDPVSFAAIEWAVGEIIDNVELHSKSHGYFCRQFYPRKHTLELSVGDSGIGIREAFLENKDLIEEELNSGNIAPGEEISHKRSLELALIKGVTSGRGQGNGLFGCTELIRQNQGLMQIWSGDAARYINPKSGTLRNVVFFQGTVVNLLFNTNNPIDMRKTRLYHEPISTYISSFDEADNIMNILDECKQTKFRKDAAQLRNKIELLVPMIDEKIVLDFVDVDTAGSSFLDELVSKLVQSLGEAIFREKFRVINIDDQVHGLLNHVVNQRNGLSLDEIFTE